MTSSSNRRRWRLTAALTILLGSCGIAHAQTVSAPELKAAFLLNFAKFTDWSGIQASAPVALCVLDDDLVGAALAASARRQAIAGHSLDVLRPGADGSLQICHLLFVPGTDLRTVMAKVSQVGQRSVVTVSDARGFAEAGGMIEFFEENGRMRFAINVAAAQRSGIRLSSRLLDLAKIIKKEHGQ